MVQFRVISIPSLIVGFIFALSLPSSIKGYQLECDYSHDIYDPISYACNSYRHEISEPYYYDGNHDTYPYPDLDLLSVDLPVRSLFARSGPTSPSGSEHGSMDIGDIMKFPEGESKISLQTAKLEAYRKTLNNQDNEMVHHREMEKYHYRKLIHNLEYKPDDTDAHRANKKAANYHRTAIDNKFSKAGEVVQTGGADPVETHRSLGAYHHDEKQKHAIKADKARKNGDSKKAKLHEDMSGFHGKHSVRHRTLYEKAKAKASKSKAPK